MKYYFQVEVTDNTYNRLETLKGAGVVHSIFNHTFNVLVGGKTLITLADETLNNGPNCIKVKGLNISDLHLIENEDAYFHEHKLIVNNKVIVDYAQAKTVKFNAGKYPKDLSIVKDKVQRLIHSQWYKERVEHAHKKAFDEAVAIQIKDNNEKIRKAIEQENDKLIRETLKKYIGLGIGLTPSGDDFLCGLAYIASLKNYPVIIISEQMKKLQTFLNNRTNVISSTQYKMALQSEVRYEIFETVSALLNEDDYDDSEQSIKSILSIGSSSGFDILQGILFGIEMSL